MIGDLISNTINFFYTILFEEKKKYETYTTVLPELPEEIYLKIFSYLPPQKLEQMSQVNKMWRDYINNQKLWKEAEFFLRDTFFLNDVWETHFKDADLEMEKIDYDSREIFRKLYSKCPFSNNKELVKDTHTILLIPKGLSLRKFTKIFPVNRSYTEMWEDIFERHGNTVVEKTHLLLITNNIIEKTRGVSFEKKKEILTRYKEYEIADLISILAINTLRFLQGKIIIRDDSSIGDFSSVRMVQCEEKAIGNKEELSHICAGVAEDHKIYLATYPIFNVFTGLMAKQNIRLIEPLGKVKDS